ncbi:MAG: hypothetical protein IPI66_03015 [Chitinophagaceae bacterium]|nr:hypothetical protein [Chitinophagaceae bacterium]MBL0055153.1 hypothetical protein [Chitinophagaceae bacterium]
MEDPLRYGAVSEAAYALKDLFQQVTSFEGSEVLSTHIETDHGRAVSPVSASFCIIDFMRTRMFIKGIAEAISFKLLEKKGNPVTVLYAGTGPFATLLTPLTTLFSPSQLKMVLIDLNPESLAYLRKTIDLFDMGDHVLEIIQADASTYQVETGRHPDIILSETMMPGLYREPIVNIFANLAAQCPRAIMIPELVRVEAALISNLSASGYEVLPLKTLMELSAATAAEMNKPECCPAIFHQGIEVEIPVNLDPVYTRLVLLTYIKTFSGNDLGLNQSSLTIPFFFKTAKLIKEFPQRLRFKYGTDSFPGFQYCGFTDLSQGWAR